MFLLILTVHGFAQERMTIKPDKFNPQGILNMNIRGYENNNGYIITRDEVGTQYPNIRVFQSLYNQSEPSITVLPSNLNRIFIGANTDYGMGYYTSTNNSASWSGNDIIPGSVYYSTNPSVAYSNTGNLYYNYIDDYIVVDRTNNNGMSWGGRTAIQSSTKYDMNSITVDQTPSSPYYGRVYAVWSNFSLNQPAIFFSYSTNNGVSFSTPQQIGAPTANHYEQGAKIVAASNGYLYCMWATPDISNNNIEDKIGFTKSINGGASWSAPTYPITIKGVRGYLFPNGLRLNSFPSIAVDNNGKIFVVWSQKGLEPAGSDIDVCFSYSTNQGASFSAPIRVNNDQLNNGKNQFLPWIAVDKLKNYIAVVFYDNRDTYKPDSCDVYTAISAIGTSTFVNIKVSDRPQIPKPLTGYSDGYFSDYIGVAANNNVIFPVWTDNRNGLAQIYTAKVELKPNISHKPLKDTENTTGPYTVTADVFAFEAGVASAKVIYGNGSNTDSMNMINTGGNTYTASIPGNGTPSTYSYYIVVTNMNNEVSYLPVNAPLNKFTFKTGTDASKPLIDHTPILSSNWARWPDTLDVYVSDNSGIDSVWVKWYKNRTNNGIKQFKLGNINGDIFKGNFNANRTDILPNDTIYYRVFAQDNSSNHNTDSTAFYSFVVSGISQLYAGNGTLSAAHPFKTFYMDARTQMIVLASELTPTWGNNQAKIMGISFKVLNASQQALNDLTIKIQNTSQSTLTGFTYGLSTVYNTGSYTISNTGWIFFPFNSTFVWNGTSNIIVEVCFNNNSINMNSSVEASSKPGLTWHQSADLPSGSGCTQLTSGGLQANRPNIAFTFNADIPTGNNPGSNNTPLKYSLKQNYPNPFNPATRISYDVPRNAFVTLKVYDVTGREVAVLVNEDKAAGTYTLDFNASMLSSGVYFYKLSSGEFTETRRMVILR